MSGALSWRHQAIIQALLSRGPLKEKDLHSMFEQLTKKNPGTDRRIFDAFILAINKALTCANFELRGCINQYDGQVYYGVVNTVSDEQSKLGTKYTVPQIAFYKAIVYMHWCVSIIGKCRLFKMSKIEAIAQDATANGFISSIRALQLKLESQITIVADSQALGSQSLSQGSQSCIPTALKNFGMSQKEKTLHEFVRDSWLNSTTEGYRLGVKSFLDLRSWFRNNDVPSCQVCNEAGIKAELCQNENCTVRIHQYCLKQLFLKKKGAKVCPGCRTSWPFTVPKEEAVQTENDNGPRESQQATGSKGKKRRASKIVEEEEVGCSNQEVLNELRASQHSSGLAQRRGRLRKTREAEIEGSGESQPSSAVSDGRRVTRNSSRLM